MNSSNETLVDRTETWKTTSSKMWQTTPSILLCGLSICLMLGQARFGARAEAHQSSKTSASNLASNSNTPTRPRDTEFVAINGMTDEPLSTTNSSPEKKDDGVPSTDKQLTIKEVMRFTMTQGLCQKVIKGNANAEEQQKLLVLLEKLAQCKPTIGTQESWDAKTSALVSAAKEIVAGKSSQASLGKAANCAACHKDHRPK